ncbi:unnamed protein product [Hymenolepis diminuta]|uniref:Uncharacterized protein n=1 Tax=Hymenolepis diminuta TaxID=6216 RepID=A0A564Z2P0_HYMDI|nr:unnamed protein product [Hymenolepis diminuta]
MISPICFPHKNNARVSVTGSYASCSSLFHTTLLSLSVTRINTRCGFLEYIFRLINSWYSAPRSLLALTQLVTVIAVVIC